MVRGLAAATGADGATTTTGAAAGRTTGGTTTASSTDGTDAAAMAGARARAESPHASVPATAAAIAADPIVVARAGLERADGSCPSEAAKARAASAIDGKRAEGST